MDLLGGIVGHFFYRIGTVIVAALLAWVGLRITRRIYDAYQELFVLWTVTFGRRWMPKTKSLRIQPYLCRTADLDDISIDECYKFHQDAFGFADQTLTEEEKFMKYRSVVMSYTYLFFCRERVDGSLRGLALLGVDHRGTHTLVKAGLMLTHKHYRGGPWYNLILSCLIFREMILHPFVPVYYIAKVSTYKSYLLGTPFPDSHPRYDKPAPEEHKKVAEDFVRSINAPIENYNRDTFVLHRRVGTIREHVATISERDLQNPHIRFFNEQNPGWREGDQLVTLVRMTWKAMLLTTVALVMKQFKKRQSTRETNVPRGIAAGGNVNSSKSCKVQRRLNRGTTYQDMEAALHSIRYHVEHEEEEKEVSENGHAGGRRRRQRNSFIDRLYSHSDDEELNINL